MLPSVLSKITTEEFQITDWASQIAELQARIARSQSRITQMNEDNAIADGVLQAAQDAKGKISDQDVITDLLAQLSMLLSGDNPDGSDGGNRPKEPVPQPNDDGGTEVVIVSEQEAPQPQPEQVAMVTYGTGGAIAVEQEQPQLEDKNSQSYTGILQMFAAAKEHLQYPKLRLSVDVSPLELSLSGDKSKYPGCVNLTDGGRYGENLWYGRIQLDGTLFKHRACPSWVVNILNRLAQFPVETAAEYGHLTGNCCFCCRPLTDQRSTDVGYGPVCASHWGLPWGVESDKEDEAAVAQAEIQQPLEEQSESIANVPGLCIITTRNGYHDKPFAYFISDFKGRDR